MALSRALIGRDLKATFTEYFSVGFCEIDRLFALRALGDGSGGFFTVFTVDGSDSGSIFGIFLIGVANRSGFDGFRFRGDKGSTSSNLTSFFRGDRTRCEI